jgi:hypothetical protein
MHSQKDIINISGNNQRYSIDKRKNTLHPVHILARRYMVYRNRQQHNPMVVLRGCPVRQLSRARVTWAMGGWQGTGKRQVWDIDASGIQVTAGR